MLFKASGEKSRCPMSQAGQSLAAFGMCNRLLGLLLKRKIGAPEQSSSAADLVAPCALLLLQDAKLAIQQRILFRTACLALILRAAAVKACSRAMRTTVPAAASRGHAEHMKCNNPTMHAGKLSLRSRIFRDLHGGVASG